MLQNYYTLRLIASDLNSALSGAAIESVFTQSKNELVCLLEHRGAVVVSCEPSANFLYLRSSFARARRNSLDVLLPVHGAVLESVTLHPSDREIILRFHENRFLLLQLFGSRANVLLVDHKRRVLDSFLRPAELRGSILDSPTERVPPRDVESFKNQLQAIGHLPAASVLKRMYPLLGSLVVREMLFRCGLAEQTTVAELPPEAHRHLFETAVDLEHELLHEARPRIYFEGSSPVTFSIIPLRHLEGLRAEEMESIHKAVHLFVSSSTKAHSILEEKRTALAKLLKEKERIERTLTKMTEEKDQLDRAATYDRYGKILLAHLGELRKGSSSVTLPDLFSPEKELLHISLDPHLSPARNAERYFDKAKRLRKNQAEHAGRLQEYHERHELLTTLVERAGQVQGPEEWREFADGNRTMLETLGVLPRGKKKEPEERSPFRRFVVDGGFEVWAGKSSENNDLLTMKHARPNDLWFHARGGSGSHVVLRSGSGKGEISKKAIHQAASIAAFYSKLKNSKLVPVAMTRRKHVRKPRGAPPGTVTIEREEVLVVEPRLPDTQG